MQTQTIAYDQDFLNRFEEGIDPINPQHSRTPARVLGYGEISTVMTISGADPGLVFKRMPMFHSQDELEPYLLLYDAYLQHLTAAGVNVVPAAITSVNGRTGAVVVYIIQEKLDGATLVNKAIHVLPAPEVERLFSAILDGIGRVFTYNDGQSGAAAIALDAQMSNWAISDYDPAGGGLPEKVELVYIDTSSPLLRVNGVEQAEPELFLRSAPSFLRWVLRLLFLDDVLNRYYDRRKVVVDVLANLYKEKRTDVIPRLVAAANRFLDETAGEGASEPITAKEVSAYYKEDARIWTVYAAFRRVDRSIHRLLGKPYPYMLPGPVDR